MNLRQLAFQILPVAPQHCLRLHVRIMDEHVIADHTNPPITTIAMPLYKMGVAAVEMLLDAIEGRQPVRNLMIEEEPRVVRRTSSAPPRTARVDG